MSRNMSTNRKKNVSERLTLIVLIAYTKTIIFLNFAFEGEYICYSMQLQDNKQSHYFKTVHENHKQLI